MNRNSHRLTSSLLPAVVLLVMVSSSIGFAGQAATVDRDIVILQSVLERYPNADLYYRLGDLYVQKGRQTGDITYFNLADSSLREAIKSNPQMEVAHRHLAFVLYSLHDFAGATLEARLAIQLAADGFLCFQRSRRRTTRNRPL